MSNPISRYDVIEYGRLYIEEDSEGEFVRFEDYEALEARVKELEAYCNRYSENLQYHITRQGAAEAELERLKAHGDPRINEVLHTAVAAIYFNDSSDYLPSLFSIARCISPRIAELLSSDEKAAFDETARLSAIANNAPAIPAEPHPAAAVPVKVPGEWSDFQAIADAEEVDAAIRELMEDSTADNGVRLVKAIVAEVMRLNAGAEVKS